MTAGAQHLTVDELEARFRQSKEVVERTHCQVIWLLAKGHTSGEVAEMVAMTPRWVNKLARRYEEAGAASLGDRRRNNVGARRLLSAADLAALGERLRTPPDEGGLWSGPKVARWIAARLGLAHVHAPRGFGRVEETGLVGAGAAAEEPEGGDAGGGSGF